MDEAFTLTADAGEVLMTDDPFYRPGDIVVTPVASHYAIGRIADGTTQEFLGSQQNRAEALKRACPLAGAKHRVFLYPSARTSEYLPVDCAEVVTSPRTAEKKKQAKKNRGKP
jgi:hypothetical protein